MTFRWWIMAVFGAWFVVSAWVLSAARHSASIEWNFIIAGALILLGSLWVALQPSSAKWRDGIIGLIALWMAISPWALGFAHHHSKDLLATLVIGILGIIGAGLSFIASDDSKGSRSQRPSA